LARSAEEMGGRGGGEGVLVRWERSLGQGVLVGLAVLGFFADLLNVPTCLYTLVQNAAELREGQGRCDL